VLALKCFVGPDQMRLVVHQLCYYFVDALMVALVLI
jgi:hypothetical protein